jgi:glycosyltransferase involved in cell wall biosynthesis
MSRTAKAKRKRSPLLALWGRRALRERLDFAIRSRLRPSHDEPLLLLSARPIVLHVRDFAFRPGAPIYGLLRALARHRVDILYSTSWNHARRRRVERLVRLQWRLRRIGDHRITFLATSPGELEHFRGAGLTALHVNNSTFLDERIFRPLPDRQVRFDAVYDARLSRFKRHPLAAEVPNLALITYLYEGEEDPEYRAAIAPIVARAHVFNGDPFSDAYRRLSVQEVNQALNQCAVGLALSREEGAMYTSIQYLMAGLPVVSTPSEGGRSDFYHPDYVRIVDTDPRAVAAAVSELAHCKQTNHEISTRTLERMQEHRERLFRCVDEIYASQGCTRSFAAEWPALFVNRLLSPDPGPTARILPAVQRAHAD